MAVPQNLFILEGQVKKAKNSDSETRYPSEILGLGLWINKKDIRIADELVDIWQNVVNIIAEIINVPSALIMKVDAPFIEVLRSSESSKNPYKAGDREYLAGLYCERVIKTRNRLLVPNALKDKEWDKNLIPLISSPGKARPGGLR